MSCWWVASQLIGTLVADAPDTAGLFCAAVSMPCAAYGIHRLAEIHEKAVMEAVA